MLGGQTLNYFAVPWAVVNNPLPLVVVTAIEVVLLGAVEKYRCGFLVPCAAVLLIGADLHSCPCSCRAQHLFWIVMARVAFPDMTRRRSSCSLL